LEASAAAQSALERAAAYRKTQASVVVPNDESSSDSTTLRRSWRWMTRIRRTITRRQ
jgi:hypothetical protein